MAGRPDKVLTETLNHFQMPFAMFPQDLIIFIQDDQQVQTLWSVTESVQLKIATVELFNY
jgi:hypothetical protein